jgi:DNA-binding beta-propeller fold protein YncE
MPTCTIDGSRSGLAGAVVTGIAVSPTTGSIYVLAKTAEFGGTGQVLVFAPERCGNVAPLAAFHDRTNKFTDGMGIAVGPS